MDNMCQHSQEYETCRFGCTLRRKEELKVENDKLKADLKASKKHHALCENGHLTTYADGTTVTRCMVGGCDKPLTEVCLEVEYERLKAELKAHKECAEDVRRLTKELDVVLCGEGAAERPMLCDVIKSAEERMKELKEAYKVLKTQPLMFMRTLQEKSITAERESPERK